jgi:hypothetical protein
VGRCANTPKKPIQTEERDNMGNIKGALVGLQHRVDGFLYSCEYIKECNKVTGQCREGGNSYCGEYKKRNRKK